MAVSGPGAAEPAVSVAGAYPGDREADIVVRDGSTVHVRPVRADDEEGLRQFFAAVSPRSIAFRFFGTVSRSWKTAWALDVDYVDRFGLVVEAGVSPAIIAHAVYVRTADDCAEIAFLVADAWQGRGISTILLAHLAEAAQRRGVTTFVAEVLPSNHRMVEVFRQSGFPVRITTRPDTLTVTLPTSLSVEGISRFEDRDRSAAVAAVRSVLEPRSAAVIGASRRRGSVGAAILHNLLASGFTGELYAVNPHGGRVQSLPAYRRVTDIGRPVDLAVVVVGAPHVLDVASDCASAGVRALVVISSGFAETGQAGAERQHELLALCRAAGMRLVGPNCLGVLNTAPSVRLNATFAPHPALPGHVAFMSQSGGLGIAIIEAAGRLGVGLSSFVSVGNKADLSANDLLRFWEQDRGTDLALLYLESFGNPRSFARIAPRFARRKPLLAVKSGRSSAGARATASHTGALVTTSDVTTDALFEQAGVIRADTLHELFGVSALLAAQPVPRGDRVVIVTNAGGPGILCADACEAAGVAVPELPTALQDELRSVLPGGAAAANPVDTIATASAEQYRRAVEAIIAADVADAILAIFVPPLTTRARDVAQAIRQVAEGHPPVTLAAVFMTSEETPAELAGETVRVPSFAFPEEAAHAVALAAKHGRWRARADDPPSRPAGTRPGEAAAVLSRALAEGREWLRADEAVALLRAYGLPVLATRLAPDGAAAADLAVDLGLPVALKASARGLIHKSDVGGVVLDLDTREAVRTAAAGIERAVADAGYELDGLVVQPMAAPGVELIAGVVHDLNFGPLLACGAGGTTAELLSDVAVRITPISDRVASEMVRSLRTFPLLDGYRGAPRCDVGAVADVLTRLSALVDGHPEIAELDCNPLVARPDGAVIVDTRVRVHPAPPAPPQPSLEP